MAPAKKLFRSANNRIFAGVCGGVGEYLDIDPTVVRGVYVLLSLLTAFAGLLAYIVLWLIIPARPV